MTKTKILIGSLVAILATFIIYSCTKDTVSTQMNSSQKVETRSSGSSCSPQTLYTEYDECTHQPDSLTLSFALGYSLYSTSSKLYALCPRLQIKAYFTKTKCKIGSFEVHFVHNLTYSLANMIAACPALQTEINNQIALGNLESFLDKIDDEISRQTEFTLAYKAAIAAPFKYNCEDGEEYYSVKYINNTCYKWVPYTDGPKDRPIAAYKKEDCGGSVCCSRSNDYCVQEFVKGEPVLTIGQSTRYQKFEGSCPLNCTHDCGGPGFNEF
jgi:hypothetical protein